jgi:hypothetical protein
MTLPCLLRALIAMQWLLLFEPSMSMMAHVNVNCSFWTSSSSIDGNGTIPVPPQLVVNLTSNTTYTLHACELPAWSNTGGGGGSVANGSASAAASAPSILFIVPPAQGNLTSSVDMIENVRIELRQLRNIFPMIQVRCPLGSIVNVSIVMIDIIIDGTHTVTLPSDTSMIELNALQVTDVFIEITHLSLLTVRIELTDAPMFFIVVRRISGTASNASLFTKNVMSNISFYCVMCIVTLTSSTGSGALNGVLASLEVDRGNQQPTAHPLDVGLIVSNIAFHVRDSVIQVPLLRLNRETHVTAVIVPEFCSISSLSAAFVNVTVVMMTICAPLDVANSCVEESLLGNADVYLSVLGVYRDFLTGLSVVMEAVNVTLLSPVVDLRGERMSSRGGLIFVGYSIAKSEGSLARGEVRDIVVTLLNAAVLIVTRQIATLMYLQSIEVIQNFTFTATSVSAQLEANGSVVLTSSARLVNFLLIDVPLTQSLAIAIKNCTLDGSLVSGVALGSDDSTQASYLALSVVALVAVLGKLQHSTIAFLTSNVFAEASSGSVPFVYGLPVAFHHTFGALVYILDRDSTGSLPNETNNSSSTASVIITQDLSIDIAACELWCLFGMYMPAASLYGFASTTSTFVSLPIVAAVIRVHINNVFLFTGAARRGAFSVPLPNTFAPLLAKTFFNFSAIVSCFSTSTFVLQVLPLLPSLGFSKAPSSLVNASFSIGNATLGTIEDGLDHHSGSGTFLSHSFSMKASFAVAMQNTYIYR